MIKAVHNSKARLAWQRSIKRNESSEPSREMKKSDIEDQCLTAHVTMPDSCSIAFSIWWASVLL